MRTKPNQNGMSLAETMVAAGMFTLLSLVLALALKQSSQIWLSNSSHQGATQRLRKAATKLEHEISMASLAELSIAAVPSSLSTGGQDGDAVCFLSHINPHDGQAYLKSDGTPFWQCNVLYYPVIPQNVDELNGSAMVGGVDSEGYEDRCPHKVLIRKVIDTGSPTDPTDEDTEETLLSDPTPFLTRPATLQMSNLQTESEVVRAELVTAGILCFRAQKSNHPKGIHFDLRSFSQEEARRVARSTSSSLLDSPFTQQNRLFVKTRN